MTYEQAHRVYVALPAFVRFEAMPRIKYEVEPKPEGSCQMCGGMGYLRWNWPIGHPYFGQVSLCKCADMARG